MGYSKEELIDKLLWLSKGSGGVVTISGNDWEVLKSAYGGNPLMDKVDRNALYIRPVISFPDKELSFR